jgi:hypothetical protein
MPLILKYEIKMGIFAIGTQRYDVAFWHILLKTLILMTQTKALLSKPLQHMDVLPTNHSAYLVCKFSLTQSVH